MKSTVLNRRTFVPKLVSLTFALASLSGFSSEAQAHSYDPSDPVSPASCGAPDRAASILRSPTPEMPAFATLAGASSTVGVEVDLMPDGRLQDATISQSSGNAALDSEALRVARASDYSPAMESCRAVPGSYLVTVIFDPGL